MIKTKKGFTLIEIIVSIALIAIIGVSTIVIVNNNKKNTPQKELESLISNASLTAYSSSNVNTEKIKKQNGYKVYTIEELKELGLLDENQLNDILNKLAETDIPLMEKCDEAEEDDDKDDELWCYKKIIIYYDYMSDNGSIGYIYPFRYNDNFVLKDIDDNYTYVIENEDSLFKCTDGLNPDYKMKYFNKNWEWEDLDINLNNVVCRLQAEEDLQTTIFGTQLYNIDSYSDTINSDFLVKDNSSEVYLSYNIKEAKNSDNSNKYISAIRKINVIDLSKAKLIATEKDKTSEISDYNKWYNSPKVFVDGVNNIDELKINYSVSPNSYSSNPDGKTLFLDKNSGKFNISATITVNNGNEISKELKSINVNVDNVKPKISDVYISNKILYITAEDNESGIKKMYWKNGTKEVEITNNSISINKLTDYQSGSIYVEDFAGNTSNGKSLNGVVEPIITLKEDEDVPFAFKINIENVEDIDISFDLPDLKLSDEEKLEFTDRVYNQIGFYKGYPSKSSELVDKTINFYNLIRAFKNWYSKRNVDDILKNFNVGVIIKGKNNVVKKWNVTLSAYLDEKYFGKNLIYNNTANSGCGTKHISGLNSNGDIAFQKSCNYSDNNSGTLYIRKHEREGNIIQVDTAPGSPRGKNCWTGHRINEFYVSYFDNDYLDYSTYTYIRFNGLGPVHGDPRRVCSGIPSGGVGTSDYYEETHEYRLSENRITYESGSNYRGQYSRGSSPIPSKKYYIYSSSSKNYYTDDNNKYVNEILSNYGKYVYIDENFLNNNREEFLGKYIFNFDDDWKSFIARISNSYFMFFFKENLDIKEVTN